MKPLIIANWKMNPITSEEAENLFWSIKKGARKIKDADVIICPPYIYLEKLKPDKNVKIGIQNCFWEEKGAYTGEISALMAKNAGAEYVIIGHSERRKYFNETDEIINKKLKAVLSAGLIPIFCIGETQEQKDKGETEMVLKKQTENGLKEIKSNMIIAYEPVWAIGTGNSCDVEDAKTMVGVIRNILGGIYDKNITDSIAILYGGSVNSANSGGYIKQAGFNGLLVGGASLKPDEFVEIIKNSI